MSTIRQALGLIGRDQRGNWLLLVLLALFVSGVEMLGAAFVYVLLGLVADPTGDVDLPLIGDMRRVFGDIPNETLLLGLIGVMAAFFVLRLPVLIGSAYVQKRVAENTGARLSNRLVDGYLRWPYSAHLRRSSAEFVRNGHQAVQELVNQVFLPLIRITAQALIAVTFLVLLVLVAPAATALAAALIGGAAVLLLLVVNPRLKRLGRTSHAMQRDTLASLQQSLHGIRDIKILGREHNFARRYARSRLALARTAYLRVSLAEVPRFTIELALIGFILAFFAYSIVSSGAATSVLPVLGLFAYAGLRLLPSVQAIVAGLNSIRFSAAPLDDLHADLQVVEALPPRSSEVEPLPFTEAIEFDDVSFRYESAEVDALRAINLTIRPGEQIGICGSTGGGKTTLVDLLTGLLEPSSGRITVDGRDLNHHTRAWQRNLGVVPQMVFLLDDTLRRNIALGIPGAEIDDAALDQALELAQLTEFVGSLPKGLETRVGERGIRISGGQRQRIAIARALYRRPSVLIFDEGTSALDNVTEAQLMDSIDRLRGRHTIILVAHRLSTVRNSDRMVLVESGRIGGEGSFDELARENAHFRMLTLVEDTIQIGPSTHGVSS